MTNSDLVTLPIESIVKLLETNRQSLIQDKLKCDISADISRYIALYYNISVRYSVELLSALRYDTDAHQAIMPKWYVA